MHVERGRRALKVAQRLVPEDDRLFNHVVEERNVVRDDDQGPGLGAEVVFEPDGGLQVLQGRALVSMSAKFAGALATHEEVGDLVEQ